MGPGVGALWPGQHSGHCGHCDWRGWGPRRGSILLGSNGFFQGQKDLVALTGFKFKVALSRDTAPACLEGKGYLQPRKRLPSSYRALLLFLDSPQQYRPCAPGFPPPGTARAFSLRSLLLSPSKFLPDKQRCPHPLPPTLSQPAGLQSPLETQQPLHTLSSLPAWVPWLSLFPLCHLCCISC